LKRKNTESPFLCYHTLIRKTRAALLVFSLEKNELDKESFNYISEWSKRVLENCEKISTLEQVHLNKYRIENISNLAQLIVLDLKSNLISKQIRFKYKSIFLFDLFLIY